MSDRAIVVAALIVGAAIITASFQHHERYALSAAGNNVVWRMDTWSGQIDLCAAVYPPNGPLVRCGAMMVVPGAPGAPGAPTQPAPGTPQDSPGPLDNLPKQSL